jgi:hypothetical protein
VSRVSKIEQNVQWPSQLDAFGLPMSTPAATTQGIAMSGVTAALRQRPVAPQLRGIGTEPCTAGLVVPRHWVESAVPAAIPVCAGAVMPTAERLGRAATNHNSTFQNGTGKQYATSSIDALVGVGASGPPRRRETA